MVLICAMPIRIKASLTLFAGKRRAGIERVRSEVRFEAGRDIFGKKSDFFSIFLGIAIKNKPCFDYRLCRFLKKQGSLLRV